MPENTSSQAYATVFQDTHAGYLSLTALDDLDLADANPPQSSFDSCDFTGVGKALLGGLSDFPGENNLDNMEECGSTEDVAAPSVVQQVVSDPMTPVAPGEKNLDNSTAAAAAAPRPQPPPWGRQAPIDILVAPTGEQRAVSDPMALTAVIIGLQREVQQLRCDNAELLAQVGQH